MICSQCQQAFEPKSKKQRFCSRLCNKRFHGPAENARHRDRLKALGLYGKNANKTCKACGQSGVRADADYCSRACSQRVYRARMRGTDSTALMLYKKPAPTHDTLIVAGFTKAIFVAGECNYCGTYFVGKSPSQGNIKRFCSITCTQKHGNKNGKHIRRERIKQQRTAHVYRQQIYKRDNYTCQLCNEPVNMTLNPQADMAPSLDHIIPLAKGGTHSPGNVQLAHRLCNSYKSDQLQAA